MSLRALLVMLGVGGVVVLLAHQFDAMALRQWSGEGYSESDWNRALRVLGYLPTWFFVSALFLFCDRARRDRLVPPLRDAWTRAVLLSLSALSAGMLAEVLKLLIRRERPGGDPAYAFRPFDVDTFSSSGLGMPSSHTTVAFGALTMVALLHPPARTLLFIAAIGCGATRIMSGAHFVSDVALGALVGVMCAGAWWALHRRNLDRASREESA